MTPQNTGLPDPEYQILAILVEAGSSRQVSDVTTLLARRFGVQLTMTRALVHLANLVTQNMVTEEPAVSGGASRRYSITGAGIRAFSGESRRRTDEPRKPNG